MVQLFMGGHGHADVSSDVDHDVDPHHPDGHGEVDPGFLPIFLSLRFWIFGSLAFGMVGSLLHFGGLASSLPTLVVASVMGMGSGVLASWIFRTLNRAQVTSGAGENDAVGHVGKVLIRVPTVGHGKVRIQLKGQTLDLLATTDETELAPGEQVLIEEMRDGRAHVSKAPPDFLTRNV
jgi:membrane protein implicated in regulation of membrane protease activity